MKERNSGPIFGCLDSHVPELGDFDNEGLVLKRKPSGPHWEAFRREGKDHKLWLMHWLIEEQTELERAVVQSKAGEPSARAMAVSGRLGGAGLATGGRKADVALTS